MKSRDKGMVTVLQIHWEYTSLTCRNENKMKWDVKKKKKNLSVRLL